MASESVDKDKDSAMVNFMNRPPVKELSTGTIAPLDTDVLDMVYTIVKAADGRKADEIVALNVEACTSLCSSIIILSGNSRPQNQAIAKAIQDDMVDFVADNKNANNIQVLPEGTADSGWMLLDYGSVMVHIMTPKSRLYYNIQGQWLDKGGTDIPLQHIVLPNTGKTETTEQQQQSLSQQDDPFWS
jgi:ribosome-associated protein